MGEVSVRVGRSWVGGGSWVDHGWVLDQFGSKDARGTSAKATSCQVVWLYAWWRQPCGRA